MIRIYSEKKFYNNDDDSILSFHGTIDRDNLNTGELYQLDVFRSWLEIENERIQSDYEEFSNFWDRKSFKINNINCEIKPLTKHLLDFFKINHLKINQTSQN